VAGFQHRSYESMPLEGGHARPENISVDVCPPQDVSQPASPSTPSPRHVEEPLTPIIEVHYGADTFSGSFDKATDTLGHYPRECPPDLDDN
jgi:hypothetical protein